MLAHQGAQDVAHTFPWPAEFVERRARGFALSVSLIVRMFGVSDHTVRRALEYGELPGFRLGQDWRVRPEAFPPELAARWMAGEPRRRAKTEYPDGPMVYFIQGHEGFIKIGYTGNFAERVRELQCSCPVTIELLAYVPGGSRKVEAGYHRLFGAARVAGEWFKLSPAIGAEIDRLNAANPPPLALSQSSVDRRRG